VRQFSGSFTVASSAQDQTFSIGERVFFRAPSLLVIVAIGLHTRNWIGFSIVVIPSMAALSYRIHVEEEALRTAFGHVYAVYTSRTKRLFPGVY
jgi:protein-S-isoprenylcysteine O-methyltransferase Ste14